MTRIFGKKEKKKKRICAKFPMIVTHAREFYNFIETLLMTYYFLGEIDVYSSSSSKLN